MNEYCYHGVVVMDERVDYTCWETRAILCKMILQAFKHSRGIEITDYVDDKKIKEVEQEKADSMDYILSIGFREDCDWLGMPDYFCEEIRKIVTGQKQWQVPAFHDFEEMPKIFDEILEIEEVSVGLMGI